MEAAAAVQEGLDRSLVAAHGEDERSQLGGAANAIGVLGVLSAAEGRPTTPVRAP